MMKNDSKARDSERRTSERGVGLVELMVVVAIVLITSVIALPNFLKVLRSSQLSNGATQMADIIKQARFQAIRRNTSVTCRISQVSSTTTQVWVDTNGNSVMDPGELQTLFVGNVNLVPAGGIPGTNSLATGIGSNVTLTAVSSTAGTYTFDARGAVSPAAVYVQYVANTAMPSVGYRAVVVLPSGSIQTWTADASGNWHRLE